MAEAKHTPTPWTVRVATASVPTIHIYSPRGHFASVYGARHAQDARLIAAAPDMLKALKESTQFMVFAYGEPPAVIDPDDERRQTTRVAAWRAIAANRALIAAAEGKEI